MNTFNPILAAALATLAIAPAATLRAGDWPEFRGPTAQGHSPEKNLPATWGPDRNVAWKIPVPGQGWSSPVVANGRVFLTSAAPNPNNPGANPSLCAIALDFKTGKTLWNVEVFGHNNSQAPNIHRKNSHASPTPVVDGHRLFVHFGHLGTAALDLNGRVLWRTTELSYPPVHGGGGSPLVVEDLLFFSCDGASNPFVVALDKASGRVRWKTERRTSARKTFSFSTPLLITVNGRKQIVSPGSDALCAYDPNGGREIWRAEYDGYSVIPRPVHGHGLLFISTGYDRPVVMAIRPDGQGNVTDTHVAWTLRSGAPNTPSMLLVGNELYMVSDAGIATCVDARTGQVHWKERVGGNYSASPVHADNKIYLQSEEGKGVVLRPGKTFEVLAENHLEERSLASYAVADGRLLVRTENHLYAIGGE